MSTMQDRYRELLLRQAEGGYAARNRRRSRSNSRVRFGRGGGEVEELNYEYELGGSMCGGRRGPKRRTSLKKKKSSRGGALSGGRVQRKKKSSTRSKGRIYKKRSATRRNSYGRGLSGGVVDDGYEGLRLTPSQLLKKSKATAIVDKYGTRDPYDMYLDTLLNLNVKEKERKLKAIEAIERIKQEQQILEAEIADEKDRAAINYASLMQNEQTSQEEAAIRLTNAQKQVDALIKAYNDIPQTMTKPTGYVRGNSVYAFPTGKYTIESMLTAETAAARAKEREEIENLYAPVQSGSKKKKPTVAHPRT